MATLSFYARGDASSANNAALNVENPSQQPTVLITFDSGAGGDLVLEQNGGAPDPDTTVTIDGVNYNFTVELTGDLPLNENKVPDALEGLQVTVISVEIAGNTERFFFVTDGSGTQALMDDFGNGAIALDNADFTPPPIVICFCTGTQILTPTGYCGVETLSIGDYVLNDAGDPKQIKWIARSELSYGQLRRFPENKPMRIAADSIAEGIPFADLLVSPQHRVVLEGIQVELLFEVPKVLMAAKHLGGTDVGSVVETEVSIYYHLLLDDHDMVVSNGLVSESVQLSAQSINGMSAEAQNSLCQEFNDDDLARFVRRPDAIRSLSAHEALVLVRRMFGANSLSKPSGNKHPVAGVTRHPK